jgi:hypothetical protein
MSTPFVKVETTTYTTVKCKCPLCGKHEWTVDHLFETAAKQPEGYYPVYWSCDKCFAKFDIRVYKDQHVEMSQTGVEENPYIPAVVLLKSNTGDNQERPIYAVVWNGSRKKTIAEEQSEAGSTHLDYHFNEGTCPTNWWRHTICLVQDQDPDPHGCFEFVKIREADELVAWLKARTDADLTHVDDPRRLIEDNLPLIYPELFEDGDTFEAEAVPKVITQGSMDNVVEGELWPKSLEQIQQENAQAWRELFTRIDRRELGVTFRSQCLMSPIQYETMRKAPTAEHHPLVFDFIVGFMNQNQIPLLSMPDPLAALEAPQLPDIGRGLVY